MTEGSGVRLQKLDANGVIQWLAGGIVQQPAAGSYAMSQVHGSDNGSVIALWVRPTGNFSSPRHLYTQKFSSAGAAVWNAGSPVAVYDGGSVQNGYFPNFVSDGAGGAVYGWYEASSARNGYVQRVNAAGAEVFAHNGVACSTVTGSRCRISSSVAYSAGTDEIFMFWTDVSLPVQSAWGVYGQKFNGSTGARMWGDSAKELVPLGADQTSFVTTLADDQGYSMAFWFDQPGGGAHVMGARLNGDGSLAWGAAPIQACTAPSGKTRLSAAINTCGDAMLAWGDARSDGGDIFAQNVRRSGYFGPRKFGDVDDNNVVNVGDLLAVINAWGSCPGPCSADVAPINGFCNTGDGTVNVADLLVVINNWG